MASPAHSSDAPPTDATRRPLKSRQAQWANALARRLANANVSPNTISVASIPLALLAAAAFVATRHTTSAPLDCVLFLLAVVGIQGRLICNLLDGMVAIEGGKKSASGPIYNEFPDRVADTLILLGAGYAGDATYGPSLGWCAALLAMLTAYVRVLGAASGAGTYFIGPMAKPHRMATLTAACALAAIGCFFREMAGMLSIALVVICIGCVPTTVRRLSRIIADLRRGASVAPAEVAS
jgi:phosphatidylglycerophosphate synthase